MTAQSIKVETVSWQEVRAEYLKRLKNGRLVWPSQPALARSIVGREGHTLDNLAQWVRDGFRSPIIQASVSQPVEVKRRRARWSEEEGDLDLSRIQAGYDDYRLDFTQRESKRGVQLECGMGFGGGVPNRVLAQYGAFLAGIIRNYEAQGFDLKVYIVTKKTSLFMGDAGRYDIRIKVKNFGERCDFTSFSALFSPLGHRGLVWTAKGIVADRLGLRILGGLGSPQHHGWSVSETEGVVEIDCNRGASADPADTLKRLAIDAGVIGGK